MPLTFEDLTRYDNRRLEPLMRSLELFGAKVLPRIRDL